jgi:4-amino-4-deoxy-L-arabinose transferase-like glycosyltransferase
MPVPPNIMAERPGDRKYSRPRRFCWHRMATVLLVSVFLVLNLALVARYGVLLGADSPGYIALADNLVQGRPLEGPAVWNLGYIAVVALCQQTAGGLGAIVGIQLTFAGLAAVAQYHLGRKLCGSVAGLVAAGLLVTNPDIVRWHAYILTDSLYTSLVILSTWSIYRASERKGHWYLIATIVVLATALVRPNGWILFPVAAVFWTARAMPPGRPRWLAASAAVLLAVIAVIAVLNFGARDQARVLEFLIRRGDVIWGYPEGRLLMPADPESAERSWLTLWNYVLRHPLETVHLAISRVATELIRARPFYPALINGILLAYLLPLYIFALLGFSRLRNKPLAHLLAAVVSGHLLIVGVTFADWSGRFLVYILPLVFVFSACTIAPLLRTAHSYVWNRRDRTYGTSSDPLDRDVDITG